MFVEVEASDTVNRVKEKVLPVVMSVASGDVKDTEGLGLIKEGNILDGFKTLVDCKVENDDVLVLVLKKQGMVCACSMMKRTRDRYLYLHASELNPCWEDVHALRTYWAVQMAVGKNHMWCRMKRRRRRKRKRRRHGLVCFTSYVEPNVMQYEAEPLEKAWEKNRDGMVSSVLLQNILWIHVCYTRIKLPFTLILIEHPAYDENK